MELNNKDVVIAGQLKTSLTENLEDFLIPRCRTLAVIGITSPFATVRESRCTLYHHGQKAKEWRLPAFTIKKVTWWNYPLITVSYLVFLFSFFLALFHLRRRFDLYVGISTFSAFIGLLYKRLGGTKRLIYYCLDFYMAPPDYGFKKWLNSLFMLLEPTILKNADFVWNLSPRIKEAHARYFKMTDYPQTIVPVSYRGSFSQNMPLAERERWTLGFIGSLSKNQGLQLAIEAMPELIKIFPALNIKVIGHGLYAETIRARVKAAGLSERVTFYGFMSDEKEANRLLSRCVLGLAPYTGDFMDNSLFTEPGKPKLYLMLGLPVVVTESISIANLINDHQAGKKIKYDKDEFIAAVREIMGSDENFRKYAAGVEKIKPYCRSEDVYGEAFAQSAPFLQAPIRPLS